MKMRTTSKAIQNKNIKPFIVNIVGKNRGKR